MLRHVLNLIGWLSDQPRCYYALTEAYCEVVGRQGPKMSFKANFVDGPWAGQSVTVETKAPRFEVTRAGKPADGVADSVFIYEPGEPRMEFGLVTQDFKVVYDGPLYGAKLNKK